MVLADDVDLDDLAERFRLSGGNIRNAALAAAFLAADDGDEIRRDHLLLAIRREYQKLGARAQRRRADRGRTGTGRCRMTATMDLVEQAHTIENPRPVPGVSGVWGLELGGQSHQVTQAQLTQIRAEVLRQMRRGMNRANVTVQGGIEGHLDKIKLHKDQYIVSRVSDLFALQSLPDYKIWSAAVEALARAETDLQASKLTAAASDIVVAETSSQAAMKIYLDYHEGTISGAGRAVTTLEWTHDIAFAIDGVLATVVTGGAVGGVLVGTGITTAGTVAQQAMEVHLDMRREVDWSGIAIDAALNVVLSLLAGRLGQYLTKSGATAWMVKKLGSTMVQRIIENLVMGRAQGIVQTTLRTIIANARGERGAMTGEQLVDALIHQLTTTDNLFHDILIGEISHRAGEAGHRYQQEQVARQQSDQRQQQQQAPPIQEQPAPPVQDTQQTTAPPVQETQQSTAPPVQEPQQPAPAVQEPQQPAPAVQEPQQPAHHTTPSRPRTTTTRGTRTRTTTTRGTRTRTTTTRGTRTRTTKTRGTRTRTTTSRGAASTDEAKASPASHGPERPGAPSEGPQFSAATTSAAADQRASERSTRPRDVGDA